MTHPLIQCKNDKVEYITLVAILSDDWALTPPSPHYGSGLNPMFVCCYIVMVLWINLNDLCSKIKKDRLAESTW